MKSWFIENEKCLFSQKPNYLALVKNFIYFAPKKARSCEDLYGTPESRVNGNPEEPTCLNNAKAAEIAEQYNFNRGNKGFYRYQHRACLDDNGDVSCIILWNKLWWNVFLENSPRNRLRAIFRNVKIRFNKLCWLDDLGGMGRM